MEKKFKVMPPLMPNYIRIERESLNDLIIAIVDLSENEAEQYGELMKQTFISHWKKKTKNR